VTDSIRRYIEQLESTLIEAPVHRPPQELPEEIFPFERTIDYGEDYEMD
jgi:hypothetical protein